MDSVKINTKFADKNGEIMIIELDGHVDQSNSHLIQKILDDIGDSGVFKVIIDFEKLYYMSSAGWGIFVGEVKQFRENGGDIKLCSMNPDINDVFQMLEFYHILEDFQTPKDAAASFYENSDASDLVIDIDTIDHFEKDMPDNETLPSNETVEKNHDKSHVNLIDFKPIVEDSRKKEKDLTETLSRETNLSELPISEKVFKIIAENPLLGTFGIQKVLKHQHFGYTKINVFKLFKLLRNLELDTKAKRYRYFRSC